MTDTPSQPFVLTEDQIAFFHTFGYLKLPGLFQADIDHLARHFDAAFAHHASEVHNWVHETHYNRLRRILFNLPDRDPALFGLLADDRLQAIAHGLLGPRFNYIPSEGNIFAGDTAWHSDEYNPHFKMARDQIYLKVALYLDPMTLTHGGFRVIPGSQHEGSPFKTLLHKHLNDEATLFGLPASEIPAVCIESTPGDVLVFNHRIQHATCGTEQSRRMLYYGLAQPWGDQDLQRGRQAVRGLRQGRGGLYAEPLASTTDPILRACLQQLQAIDSGLPD